MSGFCKYGIETAASVKNGNVGLPGYIVSAFQNDHESWIKLLQNSLDI